MASSEQDSIQTALLAVAPRTDTSLVGWVVMAEWQETDGQRFLSRLVQAGSAPWRVKGYLYEGLNGQWPTGEAHHNPGHAPGWMTFEDGA